MTYRALLVDDERLARVGLRAMLTAHPELMVAGEASNGVDAAAAIRTLAPDVVFLDIQMPDLNGMNLVAQLPPNEQPAVVFVTAHRQYALEAFGVSAVDYLLKPVSRDRLALAVSRAVRFLRGSAAGGDSMSAPPPHGIPGAGASARQARLAVRDRERLVFVDPADVPWFEVYGNYLRLVVNGRYLLLRSTMSMMTARVDPASFVRISRSALVNLQHVRSVSRLPGGQYELCLRGGVRLRSSRRYSRLVRAAFG